MSVGVLDDLLADAGATDGGPDAVAEVLPQPEEVAVTELVGDLVDREDGVGYQTGCGVAGSVTDVVSRTGSPPGCTHRRRSCPAFNASIV